VFFALSTCSHSLKCPSRKKRQVGQLSLFDVKAVGSPDVDLKDVADVRGGRTACPCTPGSFSRISSAGTCCMCLEPVRGLLETCKVATCRAIFPKDRVPRLCTQCEHPTTADALVANFEALLPPPDDLMLQHVVGRYQFNELFGARMTIRGVRLLVSLIIMYPQGKGGNTTALKEYFKYMDRYRFFDEERVQDWLSLSVKHCEQAGIEAPTVKFVDTVSHHSLHPLPHRPDPVAAYLVGFGSHHEAPSELRCALV
jgi:hypothetical protein